MGDMVTAAGDRYQLLCPEYAYWPLACVLSSSQIWEPAQDPGTRLRPYPRLSTLLACGLASQMMDSGLWTQDTGLAHRAVPRFLERRPLKAL